MHLRSSVLVACLAWLSASASWAQAPRTATAPHTTIEVLSASSTLEPGTDTWLGVRFLLEPGWHIYWRNPGDSGAPPLLLWTPPPGVTISDVEWPAPERIPYGTLVNYGFHGDVILPVRVRSTAPVTGPLSLNATWLVCRDVCVQAKARVALTLPLPGATAAAVTDWASRIAAARARVPGPLPKTWRATARATESGFDLALEAPARISPQWFFSIDEGVIDEAAAQVATPSPRGGRLALARAQGLSKTPGTLRGVVTMADGAAYELEATLLPANAPKGSRR